MMKINTHSYRSRFVPLKQKPLRNGSIYRVEFDGLSVIARLKAKLAGFNDEYYVLAAHDNPVLATRDEIKIANETEVDDYLADE